MISCGSNGCMIQNVTFENLIFQNGVGKNIYSSFSPRGGKWCSEKVYKLPPEFVRDVDKADWLYGTSNAKRNMKNCFVFLLFGAQTCC